MKAPYCPDCDGNHPQDIGCDGVPLACRCCGAAVGSRHRISCADQNPLVENGKIVHEGQCS